MRSRRGVLILQAILPVVVAALAGWAVEAWELLPMSRLSGRAGMPVALLFFGVVAFTIVKDYWGHRILFEADHLLVEDFLGTTRIRYDEVADVRAIPFYGAGLRLKPENRWLTTFEGSPSDGQKKERMSAIARNTYGCEVVFPGKSLDVGVGRFIEEVRRRIHAEGGPRADA